MAVLKGRSCTGAAGGREKEGEGAERREGGSGRSEPEKEKEGAEGEERGEGKAVMGDGHKNVWRVVT